MKTIFKNLFDSWISSALGGVAGVPKIIEGVQTHNITVFIEGLALFVLGIVVKEK